MADLSNRPLLGTIDRALFVMPSIMGHLGPAITRGLNVLVLGAPGSGKTSLLRALVADWSNSEPPPVYVDLRPARDAAAALSLINDALQREWDSFRAASAAAPNPGSGTSVDLLAAARQLSSAPASRLLIDSPPGGGAAHTLFGNLRDELWQSPHQWIVAADDVLRDELTRPPASAFFDVRLELEPFDDSEQRQMLRLRLDDREMVALEPVIGKTDGLPRSVLELARAATLGGQSVTRLLAARSQQRQKLEQLPAAASRAAAFLADRGPSSASDPHLLAMLGVSNQRARQLLQSLEDQGLAYSFPEQLDGPGRPRKLYALKEAVG